MRDGSALRATVRLPSAGRARPGAIVLGRVTFEFVAPRGQNASALLLAGVPVAEAHRPSIWRSVYEAEVRPEVLGRRTPLVIRLTDRTGFTSRYVAEAVEADGSLRPLGEIRREGIFRRRVRLRLAAELPLLVQTYLLAIALTLWRRQSSNAAV